MEPHFALELTGQADPGAVVQGDVYRFTVLTSALLRIEYSPDGVFEDSPTQTVWNRRFPVPEFTVTETETTLEIDTAGFHLFYRKGPIRRDSLFIDVKGNFSNYFGRWYYGEEPRDLLGTCRTLDKVDGACPLDHGLCSFNGHSWFDDSASLLLAPDGWVEPRGAGERVDCYYLGYGRDYPRCIADFYRLTGEPPMLPRYALGNWWSRFYRYSADDYRALYDRFAQANIPFSVAVLDLYWHLFDIPAEYGRGWGGYTWNRELIPNPQALMRELHDRGLAVALNEHPADGVRAFEEPYPAMAAELGVEAGNPVLFDIANPDFVTAYFRHLFRPWREQGLDFVWIDWQQGELSALPGLDPLWALNHYHCHEMLWSGRRPLILSRYAGLGSHRYPVGFSGDTYVTWESLRFQPYFTATAANVGYGWWSHDIGGHMKGSFDEELFARWVHLGVFSPILRLHSNDKAFIFKEPFHYSAPVCEVLTDALQLRHMLVPYLYTMNRRACTQLRQLIEPMYYSHPDERMAYDVPGQFWYGSQLIAHPVTDPVEEDIGRAGVRAWLPPGLWTDFFTGQVYRGGRMQKLFRGLESIPVLAKAGAIVPLAARTGANGVDNPQVLDVRVFPGADNTFALYEDEGDGFGYREGKYTETTFSLEWGQTARLTISPPGGDCSVIPGDRRYLLRFCGCKRPRDVAVRCGDRLIGVEPAYDEGTGCLTLELPALPLDQAITVEVAGAAANLWSYPQQLEKLRELLLHAKVEFDLKERIWTIASAAASGLDALAQIQSIGSFQRESSLIVQRHISHPDWPNSPPSPALLEAIGEILSSGEEGGEPSPPPRQVPRSAGS